MKVIIDTMEVSGTVDEILEFIKKYKKLGSNLNTVSIINLDRNKKSQHPVLWEITCSNNTNIIK